MDLGSTSHLTCSAVDTDGDTIAFEWRSSLGTLTGDDSVAIWVAPTVPGNYEVQCRILDGRGGEQEDSLSMEVRDFSLNQSGALIAHYPFSGSAVDSSGNGNNGAVHGAVLSVDRFGAPAGAYAFNGTTAYIEVPNSLSLNFQNAITVAFWMKIGAFYAREQYPISHGNWDNRWKASISNNRLRWTVKTSSGIRDLDSETDFSVGVWRHVTLTYTGSDIELYIDGNLDAFSSWSGSLLTTSFDLTIGQVLPGNQGYNFNGVLDDIRIYDYALGVPEIEQLAGLATSAEASPEDRVPLKNALEPNYPNPFNPMTEIRFSVSETGPVTLEIFDLLGRTVATIVRELLPPGTYRRTWDATGVATGVYYYQLTASDSRITRKLMLLR
jgi:hypothetical protein